MLTNNHVIENATKITATVAATGKTFKATVVGYDVTGDIALIQLQDFSGLHAVPLGDSSKVKTGDSVTALGNAEGRSQIVTAPGQITGVNQTITASDQGGAVTSETLHGMLQTDAGIVSGDSGGPLVNASGQVIGMDTAGNDVRFPDQQSAAGFAIPINTALSVAREIAAGHASSTITIGYPPFIGIYVGPGTSSDPQQQAADAGAAEQQGFGGSAAASAATVYRHRHRQPELLHRQLQPARPVHDRPGELGHPGRRHHLRQPGRGRGADRRIGHHQRERHDDRRAADRAQRAGQVPPRRLGVPHLGHPVRPAQDRQPDPHPGPAP